MGEKQWRRTQKRGGTAGQSGAGTGRRSAGPPLAPSLLQYKRDSEGVSTWKQVVLTTFTDLPGARGFFLCLSMMSPFQGAHRMPHSWVIANALVYWLTDDLGMDEKTREWSQTISGSKMIMRTMTYPGWSHHQPAGSAWSWACQWRSSVSAAWWTTTPGEIWRTWTWHSCRTTALNTQNRV